MKKLPSIVILVTLGFLSSCGPSAKETEDRKVADSIRFADSLSMVMAQQQQIADSIAKTQTEGRSIDSIAHQDSIRKNLKGNNNTKGKPKPKIVEFPWPPPKSSAFIVIDDTYIKNKSKHQFLKDVAEKLNIALLKCGYSERSYYHIPGGFVLVTRIEQIENDGSPKKDSKARWSVNYQLPKIVDFNTLIRTIFIAQPGRFRVIVFAVTNQFVPSSNTVMPKKDAINLVNGGAPVLIPQIGDSVLTEDHHCCAYIYEYEQLSTKDNPVFVSTSAIPGMQHLEKTNILRKLENKN
ncbi:MAG: hypothetical protein NTW10_00300 [Bacteroidetes bacterium]|nr:hypothetical protein [Bacteroidota bacterium]